VYGALTIGAFGAIALLDIDDPTVDDLAGLSQRRPLLVLGLGVMLVGLTGLPPTGGFVAKLFVFEAAMRAQLLWLVVIGVLASVVSAAYYFRVLLACFQPGDGMAARGPSPRIGGAVVGLAALAVIASGIAPGALLDLAQRVAY
jgi:NADH-quinone oxidoreductase subunit N